MKQAQPPEQIKAQLAAELANARQRGDRPSEAFVLLAQGKLALLGGDQRAADRLLTQAVAIYEALGDHYSVAAQTGNYGWALRRAGRIDDARPYLRRAAALFAKLGLHDYAERHQLAAEEEALLTEEVLAALPRAVRRALERGDQAGLQHALDALPLAEQQVVFGRLVDAGVIREAGSEDDEIVAQFDPLLRDIATVARGADTTGSAQLRADIEAALPELERKGWQIRQAIYALWEGQRDAKALTRGLDKTDAQLIRRVLELLAEG